MSGVVRMNMSESSYAIDSAWSLLQNDDKIEKILPLAALAVPALFAGIGAYTGAGGRFFNPETGKFDPGIYAKPKYQDPFTGGLIREREVGGDSTMDRIKGGAFGLLQGINPLAYVGAAGKGVKAARAARAARLNQRSKAAMQEHRHLQNLLGTSRPRGISEYEAGLRARYPGMNINRVQPGVLDTSMSATGRARELGGGALDFTGDVLSATGKNRLARTVGRGTQAVGLGEEQGVPELALAAVAPFVQGALPSAGGVDTSGYGSSTSSAGATGATNTPVLGNQDPTRRKKIWQGVEDSAQYGGGAVATGEEMHIANRLLKSDNMFTNRLGNEMISEIKYRIHKAHCGTEQKAECSACKKKDCLGKAHCMGERKAEGLEMVEHGGKKVPKFAADGKGAKDMKKKDDKKPAHGMVIVIGSKAGPGPSKNGKRQKLDSEKKDD